MEHSDKPSPSAENEPVSELTVGQILLRLRAGELWKVLGAMVVVVVGAFSLGAWSVGLFGTNDGDEIDPITTTQHENESQSALGNQPSIVNPDVMSFHEDPQVVQRIITSLRNRGSYEFLRNKYVSYEVAQLVAFSVEPSTKSGFSPNDIYDGLIFAATDKSNKILTANMVEIAGNLGILRQTTFPSIKDTIASLIQKVELSDWAKDDPVVRELCLVKLTIFGRHDRKELLAFIGKLLDEKSGTHSFYEKGIFECPDFWLPYVVGQPDLGGARFYAAHLISRVPLRNVEEVLYHIDFLIEQEKRSQNPDPEVLQQLQYSHDQLLRTKGRT